ncbi:hypothetical protein DFH27DRAFT_522176 [Peziza echinospora]|nr:hypothetical protein DFH27DRAFT_522176 [Peziza echinospora]
MYISDLPHGSILKEGFVNMYSGIIKIKQLFRIRIRIPMITRTNCNIWRPEQVYGLFDPHPPFARLNDQRNLGIQLQRFSWLIIGIQPFIMFELRRRRSPWDPGSPHVSHNAIPIQIYNLLIKVFKRIRRNEEFPYWDFSCCAIKEVWTGHIGPIVILLDQMFLKRSYKCSIESRRDNPRYLMMMMMKIKAWELNLSRPVPAGYHDM